MARVENKYQVNEELKKRMKIAMCRVLKSNGFDPRAVDVIHLYNQLAMNALEVMDIADRITSTNNKKQ